MAAHKRTPAEAEAHFWSRVDRSSGPEACWPWTAGMDGAGYGKVWWEGTTVSAHVVAFRVSGGMLTPEKPWVLHTCKQSRACCNYAHLKAGTPQENMDDRTRDGTGNPPVGDRSGSRTKPASVPRGEQHWNAKLDNDRVMDILAASTAGESQQSIGDRVGLTQQAISKVVRRLRWKHVA